MSTGELERVEVMGRVAKKELKLSDAATMLHLSYRQVKRLWRRYRKVGAPARGCRSSRRTSAKSVKTSAAA
jgi:transposase